MSIFSCCFPTFDSERKLLEDVPPHYGSLLPARKRKDTPAPQKVRAPTKSIPAVVLNTSNPPREYVWSVIQFPKRDTYKYEVRVWNFRNGKMPRLHFVNSLKETALD